jgi:hypothetical protein
MANSGVAAMGSATEGMGGLYSTVESHCVAGARCSLLLGAMADAVGTSSSLPAQPLVTPQKFVATAGQGGTLSSIQFASLGDTSIGFTAVTSSALDGLLETQPFYVITSPSSAVTTLGTSLAIGAWTFDLTLPSQGVQPQTILLVKGGGSTLSALVANPSVWTDYAEFNNTAIDANGVELSAYLVSYLATARQMSEAGVAGLETLMQIVDDPTWSGILFLSPPFSSTDPVLNSLLAGIDSTNLYAHHLGISGTTLLDAAPFQQSAFFGLVHSIRPGTNPGHHGEQLARLCGRQPGV